MEHYIYVVFSSTPYRIGKTIRQITREPFNHVSIALDPHREQMYSFARRYYRLPLWGGFVREFPSRFLVKGKPTHFKVCRLPVSPEQYNQIKEQLERMFRHKERYLYNHLSVLASPFRRVIPLRDAYTCVEFCTACLQALGYPFQTGRYYSVGDLEEALSPYAIVLEYAQPIDSKDDFFRKQPVKHPLWVTVRDMAVLLSRLNPTNKNK